MGKKVIESKQRQEQNENIQDQFMDQEKQPAFCNQQQKKQIFKYVPRYAKKNFNLNITHKKGFNAQLQAIKMNTKNTKTKTIQKNISQKKKDSQLKNNLIQQIIEIQQFEQRKKRVLEIKQRLKNDRNLYLNVIFLFKKYVNSSLLNLSHSHFIENQKDTLKLIEEYQRIKYTILEDSFYYLNIKQDNEKVSFILIDALGKILRAFVKKKLKNKKKSLGIDRFISHSFGHDQQKQQNKRQLNPMLIIIHEFTTQPTQISQFYKILRFKKCLYYVKNENKFTLKQSNWKNRQEKMETSQNKQKQNRKLTPIQDTQQDQIIINDQKIRQYQLKKENQKENINIDTQNQSSKSSNNRFSTCPNKNERQQFILYFCKLKNEEQKFLSYRDKSQNQNQIPYFNYKIYNISKSESKYFDQIPKLKGIKQRYQKSVQIISKEYQEMLYTQKQIKRLKMLELNNFHHYKKVNSIGNCRQCFNRVKYTCQLCSYLFNQNVYLCLKSKCKKKNTAINQDIDSQNNELKKNCHKKKNLKNHSQFSDHRQESEGQQQKNCFKNYHVRNNLTMFVLPNSQKEKKLYQVKMQQEQQNDNQNVVGENINQNSQEKIIDLQMKQKQPVQPMKMLSNVPLRFVNLIKKMNYLKANTFEMMDKLINKNQIQKVKLACLYFSTQIQRQHRNYMNHRLNQTPPATQYQEQISEIMQNQENNM